MRNLITILVLLFIHTSLDAQSRDSTYYQRVEERLAATVQHFEQNVTNDSLIVENFKDIQRIWMYHLESIKLRTSVQRNRQPMFQYSLSLHTRRMIEGLPPTIIDQYNASFPTTVNGFNFCTECRTMKNPANDRCPKCGAPY